MKERLYQYGVVIFLLLLSQAVHAFKWPFQYQFQHLTKNDGLSQSTVYTINQDAAGFMWFGTLEGLNRFDGRMVYVFNKSTTNNQLTDSFIYTAKNDPQQKEIMWLGTHNGLYKFNYAKGDFQLIYNHVDENILGLKIFAIDFGDQNTGWLSTDSGLINVNFQTNQCRKIKLQFSGVKTDKLNFVYSVAQLNKDHLVLATHAGLFKYDIAKEKIIKQLVIQHNPIVWRVFKDSTNVIWVGTSRGLFKIVEEEQVKSIELNRHSTSFVFDQNIYTFYEAQNKTLWIGSGNGVYFKAENSKAFTNLKNNPENQHSLINNTVWSIYEDNNHIVWFGTDSGVSRYNPKTADFNTLTKQSDGMGLSDSWVNSVYKPAQGPLWVSTNNGLDGFDENGKKISHFDLLDGLSSQWVYSMWQQDENTLWLGTFDGLNRLNLVDKTVDKFFHQPGKPSISDNTVWRILPDGNSHLWLGTGGGLDRFNFKTHQIEHFSKGDAANLGLTDDRIHSLHKDKNGILWVGTSRGLNRFDYYKKNMLHFSVKPNQSGHLQRGWVTGLSSDSQNRLWISTDGGISYLEKGTFQIVSLSNFEKTKEYVYSLEIDNKDNIWFSTNSGLGRLTYTGNITQPIDPNSLQLEFYSYFDGLQADEYNDHASMIDSTGKVYFGGIKGLDIIEPEKFEQRVEQPPIPVITRLEVSGQNNQTADWTQRNFPLSFHREEAQEIQLNYDQQYLTFYLAALNFANPKTNRIEYRLLGFNDHWTATVANQPFINFQGLPSGHYTLEVRAATARSNWSEQTAKLNIYVKPIFWLSRPAYVVYVISFLLLGFLYIYRYKKRLTRLKALVAREQQVSQQLKLIDATKDQFLANTSHELKTPLNAIIGLSDYLLTEDIQKLNQKETKEALSLIKSSGSRMNKLIEDILQCSTLNSGKLVLDYSHFSLSELANECLTEINHSTHNKNIALLNKVSEELPFVCADRNRVKQILLNLIGNALKFTQHGEVSVIAREQRDRLLIIVKDTGIGIDKQFHHKIFEAFEQVDGSSRRRYEGSGLGLSIVKQLVELHGTRVYVNSTPNVGTEISFALYKRKNEAGSIKSS
ncbi:two-component regulator propeller domain-containing protein [Aliikangiella maris]|uniref:histidine kinase n=2 Tax=Aliikangiella maris TaxID=3162458 RepID=A0ABV2BU75_9GAMM